MQINKQLKIVLTGGHAATPALATVEEIAKRNKNWKIYWVGPISAMESGNVITAAERALREYDVIIRKIVAGRALRRGKLWWRVKAYIKIPFGFIHAFFEIFKIKPDIVLSFGGFAALPVVFSAWILGRPVLIQEQIVGAGLANKLSSPFAKKIVVARSESLEFFPKNKTELIGNPQFSKFFNVEPKEQIGNPVTIFITGGSSGSVIMNEAINRILPQLLIKYQVIHQVGDRNLDDAMSVKHNLDQNLAKNYEVLGYVTPSQFSQYFEKADIVISRSGANTVSDIVATKRPAILIPIPWSIGDEQTKNAKKAVNARIAVILKQEELTAENLLEKINFIENNWKKMVNNVTPGDFALDHNAAKRLVDILEELV
ncbi:UDP-N-acetylglucosamine--N-acetylmuramyl-(pentapeptide) pyrophosphoryl-undecaprenol N-acetylglucosamine transferase [Candidatus Microgenomates bacterium]|nr:UDP-N-acetylglucosamine--N-acetylmuramyl-(pentapeptide) pyrophosphoryl-undecaprenol N-acetylglucosamine transferase [Candidatus Microgenomates bacterium]